jgi:SAM-dependent methyltransferase
MEMSPYYLESVDVGRQFQQQNKSWAGYDVVKYQTQIKDLVDRYSARTILDYGCGKGLQYQERLPYGRLPNETVPESQWQTFDQYLGVSVYCYDPCVEGFEEPPPPGTKFDGVICTQVLNSIPDDDMPWVRDLLQSYSGKFCFIGLNFQRQAKGKKAMYDPAYFRESRTREFFKKYYNNWTGSDLFWWFKDRSHYAGWVDDQLDGTWQDVPTEWSGKYEFVETIYR